MSVAAGFILLLLLLLPIIAGVILIIMSRRRSKGYPACGKCGYDVSGTLGTTTARCPECGLISVNVLSEEHLCPECGVAVELYVDEGVPEPTEGWPCPDCSEPALAFVPVLP